MSLFLLLAYNALWPFGVVASLPVYAPRMWKRGGYRRGFGQRFGLFSMDLRKFFRAGVTCWIRAVSVGEMVQALRLAEEAHRQDPRFRAVISTTTSTGYALGQARADHRWLRIIYNPLDWYPLVARAWRRVQPRSVLLIDSDLWPSFLACARVHQVPVYLANARMSPRSARRYAALRFVAVPLIWRALTRVFAQYPDEVPAWLAVGVSPERVVAVGSTKNDLAAPPPATFRDWLVQHGCSPQTRQFLLGGSLHPGEEELLLEVFAVLRAKFPELVLILVPRHVERAAEIGQLLTDRGVLWTRRTEGVFDPGTSVLLVDTTGELPGWYEAADVVVVGKSFRGVGGQNPVEALQAQRPVICGPHMENFATLVKTLVAAGGITQLSSETELPEAVSGFLADPSRGAAQVARAERALAYHQGSTRRIAAAVLAGEAPR